MSPKASGSNALWYADSSGVIFRESPKLNLPSLRFQESPKDAVTIFIFMFVSSYCITQNEFEFAAGNGTLSPRARARDTSGLLDDGVIFIGILLRAQQCLTRAIGVLERFFVVLEDLISLVCLSCVARLRRHLT